MVQKSSVNHGMIKYQPQLVSWISEPSTVSPFFIVFTLPASILQEGKIGYTTKSNKKNSSGSGAEKAMSFTGIPWNSHFFHPKIDPPPPWKTALWRSTQAAIAEEKIRRVGSLGGVTTSPRMLVRMLMILKTFNGIHLHHHDHGAISIFFGQNPRNFIKSWIIDSCFFLGSLSHLVSKAVEQEKKKANAIMGEVPKKLGDPPMGLCFGFLASCHHRRFEDWTEIHQDSRWRSKKKNIHD